MRVEYKDHREETTIATVQRHRVPHPDEKVYLPAIGESVRIMEMTYYPNSGLTQVVLNTYGVEVES